MGIFSGITRIPVNMHFLAPPSLPTYTPQAPGTNGIGTSGSSPGAQSSAAPAAGGVPGAGGGAPPAGGTPAAGMTGGNGGIMNALMKMFGMGSSGAAGTGGAAAGAGLDPATLMATLGMMG